MKIVVNGTEREIRDGITLPALLEELGIDRRYLVVEHNGEPVGRDAVDGLALGEGDRLELVRPVAGG